MYIEFKSIVDEIGWLDIDLVYLYNLYGNYFSYLVILFFSKLKFIIWMMYDSLVLFVDSDDLYIDY